ncbi:MAG TPA: replication initiation protein [Gammaproteobacteria bacterium]|nr:replication initiation protein [Gammaproteobacteria bacterium]
MGRHVTFVGEEDKKELKKHAATIHCSNSLSLLQRKVTNALLYHAYKELMVKEEHVITVKQLCRLIGYQGNNHAAIKEAMKGLMSTIIEWNIAQDETGSENWTASSIIASVSLEGPLCYYAYSPRMKQLLHSPSMFGKIDLVIQSRFRSSYGLALYENCIRYCGLPYTKWFEMALFKKLMGVPIGKYDIFRDFKRRVLDQAVNEVNAYSDLIVSPEFVREGRQVVRLRFTLKEREKKNRLGQQPRAARMKKPVAVTTDTLITATETEKDNSTEQLVNKLETQFGLSSEQLEQLLATYGTAFIQDKVTLIEASKPYREGSIQNLTAYLLSAIRYNYQPGRGRVVEEQGQDTHWLLEMTVLKRAVEAVRQDYFGYRERVVQETIAAMPLEERSAFLQTFTAFAESTIKTILRLQRHKYTKDNVHEAPQIKALLRQFAMRELDSLNVISLEEFVVQQGDTQREAWQRLKSYDPEHVLLRFSE